MARRRADGYVMISIIAERYNIHPQTLRLYEREGLIKPSRTSGNTRLYGEDEIRKGTVTVKDLRREDQFEVPRADLVSTLRVELAQAEATVKAAADKARKASSHAALWLFISLLSSAFFASWIATYGGRQRDL